MMSNVSVVEISTFSRSPSALNCSNAVPESFKCSSSQVGQHSAVSTFAFFVSRPYHHFMSFLKRDAHAR